MIRLDERDIKILSILQQEGRITKTALAERVNLSPTPCWDRLKRLESEGVIEGYGARINIARMGTATNVWMMAEIDSHQARDFDRFEGAVEELDEVLECWALGGGIDYLLRVVTPTVSDYQAFVDRLLEADIGLKRYTSYIVTKQIKGAREFSEGMLSALRTVSI